MPEVRIACETLVKSQRDAWTYARQWEEQSRRQLREREAAEAATEPIEEECGSRDLIIGDVVDLELPVWTLRNTKPDAPAAP
jgi:hypothetical protein